MRHPGRGQAALVDERLAELRASLSVIQADSRTPVMATVVRELSEAFGATSFAFRASPGSRGWELDFNHGEDVGVDLWPGSIPRLRSSFQSFLRDAPTRWSAYDALRPEPAQRDRVFGPRAMRRIYESGTSPVARRLYEPLGMMRPSHMRVLVCDGPFLLAWVGLWRTEPLGREDVRRLSRLVAPLRRRLRIERILASSLSLEAVALALEAIAAPAFLVRAIGTVEFANEAGVVLLERGGRALVASLQAAMRARHPVEGVSVTPLQSGSSLRAIVVLHGEGASGEARIALATRRWGLTPRQVEVLILLARGDANKDIANKLRCGPRTVEIHVAAILSKARAESRGQLIARFWSEVQAT